MAPRDWQTEAETYAAKELDLFPDLDPATQTAVYRVVIQAYKIGALAGLDRAREIDKQVRGK